MTEDEEDKQADMQFEKNKQNFLDKEKKWNQYLEIINNLILWK